MISMAHTLLTPPPSPGQTGVREICGNSHLQILISSRPLSSDNCDTWPRARVIESRSGPSHPYGSNGSDPWAPEERGAGRRFKNFFFCFFQFFSSVPAPVWASRKFLKLFLDFISIFKILNLKRAPKILLCAFFIVIRLLNKLTVVFRNRLLLSFLWKHVQRCANCEQLFFLFDYLFVGCLFDEQLID